MKKKVLGIGEIVLDTVHRVASFPQEGEKIASLEVEHALGGPIPAGLILLSRLGVECTLVASVGTDEAGLLLKAILAHEGVHLLAENSTHTPIHTVLVNAETGSRTIIKDRRASRNLAVISREVVQSADVILCDRHETNATIQALHDKRPETPVIMDPSVDCSSQTIQLLKKMNFPIVPIETLSLLFPKKSIKEGGKKLSLLLNKTVVITMGKYGSAVCANETFIIHPSVSVKVVDTLGAGDIFRGGFTFGVLNGWNIHHCVEFANLVAALQCTKLGNSTAIPTKAEIRIFQKSIINKQNLLSSL